MTYTLTLHRVSETDFAKEGKVLLDYIEKLKRGEPIMQAASAAPQQPGYSAPAAAPKVSALHLILLQVVHPTWCAF